MPRYVYRLQPALALAFSVAYHPGEWSLFLRARSEAASVELKLEQPQAELLRRDLLAVAESFGGDRFPLSHARPLPPDDHILRFPTDLEAPVRHLKAGRHPHRRLMFVQAEGQIEGMPYEVEIWSTPEQMLALAEQIGSACAQAQSRCPVCGQPMGEGPHVCPAEGAEGA
ncbi:MAG: DUF3090 family protein [Anaerolineae bacterium]|nr:DUF3090 family protein [Anaerolineae bacterium]